MLICLNQPCFSGDVEKRGLVFHGSYWKLIVLFKEELYFRTGLFVSYFSQTNQVFEELSSSDVQFCNCFLDPLCKHCELWAGLRIHAVLNRLTVSF